MGERSRRERGTEPEYALPFRRDLRDVSTRAEQLLWAMVRDRRMDGQKFRRQHTIGPYIVDFVCVERSLIVEIDGGYHDYVVQEDLGRERHLKELGFVVLRFWNEDVLKDAEAVAQRIRNALKTAPSP
jgi:very-short-patch-repair endonuclease